MTVELKVARDLAHRLWGIDGEITSLPGERDLNFKISGERASVLKVYGDAPDNRALLALQDRALLALSGKIPGIAPTPTPSSTGGTLVESDGRLLRVLSWIEGAMWAEVDHVDRELIEKLGKTIARVDSVLATVELTDEEKTILNRPFIWNMLQVKSIATWATKIPDSDLRTLVLDLVEEGSRVSREKLDSLPRQLIHNDGNDWNIVVADKYLGLIDFGDIILAPKVVGLAVAGAYIAMKSSDPSKDIAHLVRGYHSISVLTPLEVEILYDLVKLRVASSIANAALQLSNNPDNEYLAISQGDAPRTLKLLCESDSRLALFRFRNAIGLDANPDSKAIRQYLLTQARCESVVSPDIKSAPKVWIDWSVDAGQIPRTSAEIARVMRENGAALGIGRYCENRAVYASDAFDASAANARTFHLGVDLWQEVGSPVFAPLDGEIELFNDNATYLDYGPVVIMRHVTDSGIKFWTLYGHLSKKSLAEWSVGKKVKAGEIIGWMGDESENVGWPPHVHFQLLTDLCGMGIDVYGVAPRDEVSLWRSISPNPNLILGIAEGTDAHSRLTRDVVAAERSAVISRNLSLNFKKPLHIVRGSGAYLYDEEDRPYLDLVNNVAHVGHCHPRVVAAGERQMRTLNTNTRYLHQGITEYARSIISTLPQPLSVMFFVNSGSEANDLAIRLARAYTGRTGAIALRHGYHGHTASVVEISPYKFLGKGGLGVPANTRVAELPDIYRGVFRGKDAVHSYLRQLENVIEELGANVGAFFAESIVSTAGQIVLPDGYLPHAYEAIRKAGGVCVSDEVQIGLGRVGETFWGFELHGVIPDIVTMGKPLGNGHPLAAVATTPEIASAFNNGMEYFNTFGGNPVSAAIGQAVFDVVEDEGLQRNATVVGNYLQDSVRALGRDYSIIGDVRGSGLFIGVEMMRDENTPATEEVSELMEYALTRGVMLSCDGPDNNVLKIKPPLIITKNDVDLFLNVLSEWLVKR